MKFVMLQSGSAGNCFLLESEHSKIMIDCGGTKKYLQTALAQLHCEIKDIDALLLTHGHVDHIAQIKQFKDTVTFGTFQIENKDVHLISTHATFNIKDMTITSLPLSHDYKRTVGYKIECDGETLVYVTDTGYINESLIDEIKNADYYIWESNHDPYLLMKTNRAYYIKQRILSSEGHLSNEDSARLLTMLVGDKTKEVILAHISREANTYELAVDTLYRTFEKAKIPVYFKVHAATQSEMYLGGNQ